MPLTRAWRKPCDNFASRYRHERPPHDLACAGGAPRPHASTEGLASPAAVARAAPGGFPGMLVRRGQPHAGVHPARPRQSLAGAAGPDERRALRTRRRHDHVPRGDGLCAGGGGRHAAGAGAGREPRAGRSFRARACRAEHGVFGDMGDIRHYLVRHLGRHHHLRGVHDGHAADPDQCLAGRAQCRQAAHRPGSFTAAVARAHPAAHPPALDTALFLLGRPPGLRLWLASQPGGRNAWRLGRHRIPPAPGRRPGPDRPGVRLDAAAGGADARAGRRHPQTPGTTFVPLETQLIFTESHMFLRTLMRAATGLAALAITAAAPAAHAADKVRIGYWSSGVSLGYGSVLEATDFFRQRNLDIEFVRFPDVNAPLRALASNSIDLAFGAPAAGVFSSVAEGVPIKVYAATQPADVQFVVPEDSDIKTIEQFRGKKVGMSPAGSSVAAIAGAILAGNHGIGVNDFSLVGGDESRLVQFLAQRQVDAAALRSVTLAQLDELKVRRLGSFAQEWQRLTQSHSVPYIGIGAVRS